MTAVAKQFASGQLELRIPIRESGELADLARAMNEMARQLSDRIATITRQRNESEAILASMVEGVLAVDSTGHVVRANKAAVSLLDVDNEDIRGRSIEEVVRNPQIQDFIKQILDGKEPAETDIFLQADGRRYFQLHGARLAAGQTETGAVIVLNDMTRMRRLESVRRDFVANVSHELKTPITSIKGFVETLLEGAPKDPEQSRRFLEIIAKHSDRLNAIIEDLLSLSRLEAESEQRKISFEKKFLKPVIDSAVELSKVKAEDKKVMINVSCPNSLEARINAPLLEQAVLNLIDNAIKYSDSGSTVAITAESKDDEIAISVTDHGCGIEKKHLSRLFERFYVVDKGRSRKLGGTGLGLAIVKHICQVHGGYVTADSSPGRGSTFIIHLPTEQSA
jgi:two-component system phosphate regulon sensor histidine kinase PhoR